MNNTFETSQEIQEKINWCEERKRRTELELDRLQERWRTMGQQKKILEAKRINLIKECERLRCKKEKLQLLGLFNEREGLIRIRDRIETERVQNEANNRIEAVNIPIDYDNPPLTREEEEAFSQIEGQFGKELESQRDDEEGIPIMEGWRMPSPRRVLFEVPEDVEEFVIQEIGAEPPVFTGGSYEANIEEVRAQQQQRKKRKRGRRMGMTRRILEEDEFHPGRRVQREDDDDDFEVFYEPEDRRPNKLPKFFD